MRTLMTLLTVLTSSPIALGQQWERMPLVTSDLRAAGSMGGEGGQVVRAVALSAADPSFALAGTDVGGVYRSLDGGRSWHVTAAGYSARGANAFAIDPRNADHAIAVAGNSTDWGTVNGLYLTTDRAASWRPVLPQPDAHEGSAAFDPASFDATAGHCRTAYFASKTKGIWKSTDGGATWAQAYNGLNSGRVAVHPTSGVVYVASNAEADAGLWRSEDGGASFTHVLTEKVGGLDVVTTAPDDVYVSVLGKVLRSTDAGRTFAPYGRGAGLPADEVVNNVRVSPADRRRLVAYASTWATAQRFYSHNGGDSWARSTWDNAAAFLPFNTRDGVAAWHPTDGQALLGIGGDWVTCSDDGGRTFRWSSAGENAIMLGGGFNFSPTAPDTVCLFFQDYNGAFTTDGGATWNYRDVSGKGWGGYCYGGYAVDATVMYGGDAPDWGGKRKLRVSRDGGATWPVARDGAGNEIAFTGPDVGYSDPRDPNVCFASDWRSADKGATWAKMDGCDGVFIASPSGGRELIGKHGRNVVVSRDGGRSWQVLAADGPERIRDVAYDPGRNRLYVAAHDAMHAWEAGAWTKLDTPRDQFGNTPIYTVTVDPVDPSIVYAGGSGNVYLTHATVVRSTDAGRTWENLTDLKPLASATATSGPHEVNWARVHPVTRQLWVNGQCFGMWRLAPPTSR
jgi:photosystem II stability/assembly factor-like uncharacterized protein